VHHPKSHDTALLLARVVVGDRTDDRGEDLETSLASVHLTAELLPRPVARNPALDVTRFDRQVGYAA